MNERIKELYNQSGGLVRMYDGKLTYFPAYKKNVGDGNFEFSSFDPEKFAELIVRECNQAVLEVPVYYKDYRNQIEEAVIRDCARAVLEKFGVEK